MKNIFVDTNIIIDLLADRKPFSKFAIIIFNKAENKSVNLYTSSHSIATAYYLLKKYIDEKSLREIIYSLLDYIHVIPIDINIIKRGLKSMHKDFEDALQILSAGTISKIECIVTRNIKDYKSSDIIAITPDELVHKI